MTKKHINPKDLEVNREYLSEQTNNSVYADASAEYDAGTICVTNVTCNNTNNCGASEEHDTGTLCVTEFICAPTDKNCPETQGNAGNCQPITKQEGCVNTKNNCVSNFQCGDSNDICLVSRNICPQTRDNCQESVDICPQTKNNCPSFNNCDTNATCPLPATRVQTRCVKE